MKEVFLVVLSKEEMKKLRGKDGYKKAKIDSQTISRSDTILHADSGTLDMVKCFCNKSNFKSWKEIDENSSLDFDTAPNFSIPASIDDMIDKKKQVKESVVILNDNDMEENSSEEEKSWKCAGILQNRIYNLVVVAKMTPKAVAEKIGAISEYRVRIILKEIGCVYDKHTHNWTRKVNSLKEKDHFDENQNKTMFKAITEDQATIMTNFTQSLSELISEGIEYLYSIEENPPLLREKWDICKRTCDCILDFFNSISDLSLDQLSNSEASIINSLIKKALEIIMILSNENWASYLLIIKKICLSFNLKQMKDFFLSNENDFKTKSELEETVYQYIIENRWSVAKLSTFKNITSEDIRMILKSFECEYDPHLKMWIDPAKNDETQNKEDEKNEQKESEEN